MGETEMKLVLIEDDPMAHDHLSLTQYDGRKMGNSASVYIDKWTTRSGLLEVIEEFRVSE